MLKIEVKYIAYIILAVAFAGCDTPFFSPRENYQTPFEQTDGTKSSSYEEVIEYYKDLSKEFASISFKTMGQTDNGQPLHLVIYSPDAEFNLSKYHKDRTIVFINNAIHGNEPDGVDATMLLFRNLAQNEIKLSKNVIVVTIPVYNIGGMLTGKKNSEANYNLNCDFVKADVENTLSFAKILQEVQPDIFIDNHVIDVANASYVLSYSTSQIEKLGVFTGGYVRDALLPRLSQQLEKRQLPFQSDSLRTPFKQLTLSSHPDIPRYATGYVSLWNCMSIRINTNGQKPYKQRVEANYEMMKTLVEIADADNQYIKQVKIKQTEADNAQKEYSLEWEIDSTQYTKVDEKPLYNHFKPVQSVSIPQSYIVPKVWQRVIDRLKANGVAITEIEKDTLMNVTSYRIEGFKTYTYPFEGHYFHHQTQVSSQKEKVQFYKGDYLIEVAQPAKHYLLETLEPQAPDSFFNWNFFDSVLGKEEGKNKPIYPIYRKE